MKYHKGQCEVCQNSRPKPLDSVTFVCFADTGRTWGDCDVVSKNRMAKRKCYLNPIISEINRVVLHELLHLCGCNEDQVRSIDRVIHPFKSCSLHHNKKVT